ncbi:MAG: hypothetical protein F6K19_41615 [Cyanothece sp. SIO1E1]|nr:hypothetical protein [Cyanothece sp. SIO1E1]
MRERLEKRLQELKAEYKSGQQVLADLATKTTNVRETLLRIAGAIQVLEEELAQSEPSDQQTDNAAELLDGLDLLAPVDGQVTMLTTES